MPEERGAGRGDIGHSMTCCFLRSLVSAPVPSRPKKILLARRKAHEIVKERVMTENEKRKEWAVGRATVLGNIDRIKRFQVKREVFDSWHDAAVRRVRKHHIQTTIPCHRQPWLRHIRPVRNGQTCRTLLTLDCLRSKPRCKER